MSHRAPRLLRLSASSGLLPCPSSSSTARPCSATRRWRSSTATASTALRASHKAATAAALKPIIGAELTLIGARGSGPGSRGGVSTDRARSFLPLGRDVGELRSARRAPTPLSGPRVPGPQSRLCPFRPRLLQESYRNLCRLITTMKLRAPKEEGALTPRGSRRSRRRAGGAGRPTAAAADRRGVGGLLDRLVGIFGCSQRLRRTAAPPPSRRDLRTTPMLVSLPRRSACRCSPPTACASPPSAERPLLDVLTCIREHTTLSGAGRRLVANSERHLKSPRRWRGSSPTCPGPSPTRASSPRGSSSRCADLGYQFPAYPVPPGETMASFLRQHRRRRRAPPLPRRITTRRAPRSSASWRSSKSSIWPATS